MQAGVKEMYHTQEKWNKRLREPIECKRDDAWLGNGYYLWYYLEDAEYWGHQSKKSTGFFEVYSADISMVNVLDTVFNEEHYLFWVKVIEKAAKNIVKKTNQKPTLKEVNDWFRDHGVWNKIDGILFQDISANPSKYLVNGMQYKKRIQLVAYSLRIIDNFALHLEIECQNIKR